jgi:hypothetical protein
MGEVLVPFAHDANKVDENALTRLSNGKWNILGVGKLLVLGW